MIKLKEVAFIESVTTASNTETRRVTSAEFPDLALEEGGVRFTRTRIAPITNVRWFEVAPAPEPLRVVPPPQQQGKKR
jgi:hypothetical protein